MRRGTQLAIWLAAIIAVTAAVTIVAFQRRSAGCFGCGPLHDRALSHGRISASRHLGRARKRSAPRSVSSRSFYQFQFHRSRARRAASPSSTAIVDDAGRFYKPVPLRSRHRHRRGRRGRRRTGGPLFRQPARRQPALEESRRRKIQEHHAARRASRSPIGSASPPRSPTSTTTATRTCSSRRSAVATCCSRTTAADVSGTSRKPPASTTSATPRARCSSTTTTTACSICTSATSADYTTDEKGRGGAYVGLSDALLRTPASRPHRARHPLQEPGRQPVQERHQGGRPRRRRLERRCERRRPERRRLSRISTCSTCRAPTTSSRTVGGKHVRGQDRAVLSEDAVGQHGHQVLRLRQRRAARPLRHRHALRHERAGPARAREAEVAHAADDRRLPAGREGPVHLRQRLLPRISAPESSRRSRIASAPRTTGPGGRASAT